MQCKCFFRRLDVENFFHVSMSKTACNACVIPTEKRGCERDFMFQNLGTSFNREIDSKLFSNVGDFCKRAHPFKMDINSNLCSPKSKILPQISSKVANFLSAICAIISTPKILSYGNNSGDTTKRLFFDEATHKNPKDLDQYNLLNGNLADDRPGVLCTVTSQSHST